MENTSFQKEFSAWNNCPPDVLILIFKYLDIESISSCLQVNRSWKDVCIYYCDHVQLWDLLVKNCLFNYGRSYKQKSKHNSKEMFLNAMLWQHVASAKQEIKDFYTSEAIKHIHVNKDTLIVVYESSVNILDVNTFGLLKTLDISCADYQETSNIVAILYAPIPRVEHSYTLKITKKGTCHCSDSDYHHPIPHANCYTITQKACFFFDERYTLWAYKPKCGTHLRVLGKHYGQREPIHSIKVHTNGIYICLLDGSILQVNKSLRNITLTFRFEAPPWIFSFTPLSFDRFNVVYGIMDVPSTRVWETKKKNARVLVLPNLTAATSHGDILLLGFKNGGFGIYKPGILTASSGAVPELEFDIKLDDTPMPIREIEVYEGDGTHIIFALIGDRIAKVELTYPQFDNLG